MKKEVERLRAELTEVKAELSALQGALDRFMRADGVQSMIVWTRVKLDAGVKRAPTEFQPANIRQDI